MISFTIIDSNNTKGTLLGRVFTVPGEPLAEKFLNLMGNAVWECRPQDCGFNGVTLQEHELMFYYQFNKYFPVLTDLQHELKKPAFARLTQAMLGSQPKGLGRTEKIARLNKQQEPAAKAA